MTLCTRCGINEVPAPTSIEVDPLCDPCADAIADAPIIALAASRIIQDDPNLDDYLALDAYDRALLIRDYRDEFASSPFPLLADAKLLDPLIFAIRDLLDSTAARLHP